MSEFASDSSKLQQSLQSSKAQRLSQSSEVQQSSQRPFSVIPQSLRDAAALRAAQRRQTDIGDDVSDEGVVGGNAAKGASINDACGGSFAGDGAKTWETATDVCGSFVDGLHGDAVTVDRYGIPKNATLDERLAYVQRMMQREAAAAASVRHPREKSPEHGVLQDFVNGLFEAEPEGKIKRLDVVVAADSADLNQDLMEIIELLPPGTYTRQHLCSQLNSAIGAHAWSHKYGMVK